MTEPRTCTRCGRAIADDGRLEGLCAACLLGYGKSAGAWTGDELEQVRARFPQFEVLEPIGRGGMGVVYRARQVRLDRVVALKVLREDFAADPTFAERFEREARALARLSHPNIIAVYDFGEVDGRFYLVMEYIDGTCVRELIRAGHMLPKEALAIVPQICAGLQYAHEQGVVHRDIKPENILVDQDGGVKIADFGLAKLVRGKGRENLTRSGQVVGTPMYMAPEQLDDPLSVDHRADIYSLGVVLYEMLTRELPMGNFEPPSMRAQVDVRLDEVVLKTLQQQPERRYQHASEVQTRVEEIQQGRPVATVGADGAQWLERLPGSPLPWGALGLVICWSWLRALHDQVELEQAEWLSVAYPFAFLAVVAARSRSIPKQLDPLRHLMTVAGLASCALTAYFLARLPDAGPKEKVFEAMAAAALVIAHLAFDFWARRTTWQLLLGAVGLMVISVVMHSSLAISPGREAYYYASGVTAVVTAASGLILTAELSLPRIPAYLPMALLRAFGFAATAAVFYFHRHIF